MSQLPIIGSKLNEHQKQRKSKLEGGHKLIHAPNPK